MTLALRLVPGTAATLGAYGLLIVAFAFFSFLEPMGLRLLAAGLALALGIAMAWACGPDGPPSLWAIVRTVLKSRLICFAIGFFGPRVIAPGANQGPMPGFFTGPVGPVAGGLHAFVRELRGRDAAEE